MRIKESWTIDEDLSKWVRRQDVKSSEFVNRVLREAMTIESNLYSKFDKIERKINSLEEEKKELIKEIKTIAEEGDKKAREAAQKKLEEEKRKEEKRNKKIQEVTSQLIGAGYLSELLECKTDEDLLKFEKKLQQNNFCMNGSILPGVGIVLLKEISMEGSLLNPLEVSA